jgi:hypothetical protein
LPISNQSINQSINNQQSTISNQQSQHSQDDTPAAPNRSSGSLTTSAPDAAKSAT